MNILSLFDGISCGQLALQRAGIGIENYFASEVESQSIEVTQKHFPNTVQLGDIQKLDVTSLPKIDVFNWRKSLSEFKFCWQDARFRYGWDRNK